MIPRSKQIVIDKSAFDGIGTNALCDFAKHHLLVAPGVLLYECATSKNREKKRLLQRYERLIREGACCCPRGREFAEWEARHCCPYPVALAYEEDMTQEICRGEIQLNDAIKLDDARQWERRCTRGAHAKYIKLAEIGKQRVAQECPNWREEIKRFPSDRSTRLHFILNLIDTRFDIHDMAVRWLPSDGITGNDQFCLSDEWMTWHRMRIGATIAYEYSYKNLRHSNTPGEGNAEHDDQDGEYVLLLCRADGIITNDKGLTELARAAFPEKDVFSSLEEVPESYRCDWAHE